MAAVRPIIAANYEQMFDVKEQPWIVRAAHAHGGQRWRPLGTMMAVSAAAESYDEVDDAPTDQTIDEPIDEVAAEIDHDADVSAVDVDQSDESFDPSTIPDELLRPALELAFAVAVAGQRLRPPLPSPPALRPFLKFQKLPGSALPVVRRAVEDDAAFRSRIGLVATDDLAGPLGVVWLSRPTGWKARAARLVDDLQVHDAQVEVERAGRSAERRRSAAEHAATKARAELAAAQADIVRERDRRVAAERDATAARAELATLQQQLADARQDARKARDQATSARTALGAGREAHEANVARVAELERLLDAALAARHDAEMRAETTAGQQVPVSGGARNVAAEQALRALGSAASGLRDLAAAMELTARAVMHDEQPAVGATRSAGSREPARRTARRTPLAIPGGLFGDSSEAAAHLLRQRDVTLVVDGYNVAKLGWPDLELAEQRERLLDVLEDLVRRIGTRTVVVFDGADVACPPSGRRLLRVKFTPAGVLADDEIRSLVAVLPPERPVVVVTNDQEIVRDVRGAGANTLASEQLLAVARR
jgi:predicted RNA-binding protein with PIN domain